MKSVKTRMLLWALSIPLLILTALACDKAAMENGKGKDLSLTDGQRAMVERSNQFAFTFYKELNKGLTPQMNALISPLSIQAALAMTANGAEGETRDQILKGIGLEGIAQSELNEYFRILIDDLPRLDPQVQLEIANSIWHRQDFNVLEAFREVNERSFSAQIHSADFDNPQTVSRINQWATAATRGLIPQIVDQIDPLTVMFLINAVYFKGEWTDQFDPEHTTKEKFKTAGSTSVDADFMWREGVFTTLNHSNFRALELPYGGEKYSMILLKPNSGTTPAQVIDTLNKMGRWQDAALEHSERRYRLGLPKLKFSYESQLNAALQAMGMQLPFTEGADFTRINPDADLMISAVKHKSFIEVNEEGTEAAAVTSVEMVVTSMPLPPEEFKLDEPFLFVIAEKSSGLILFLGQVNDPTNTATKL